MKINKHNYEMFVIDYIDGKLDAAGVSELLLFIGQNPVVKKELELLNTYFPATEKENEGFDKSILKKPVFADIKNDFREKLVARLEGDLSLSEKSKLEKAFAVYPELRTEAELFEKTKLYADKSMVFTGKKQLKKNVPAFTLYFNYAWKVAASLAVFGLILFYTRTPRQKTADITILTIPKIYFRKEPVINQPSSPNESKVASLKSGAKNNSGKKRKSGKVQMNDTETGIARNFITVETIEQKGLQPVNINKNVQLENAIPLNKMNVPVVPQNDIALKQDDRYKVLEQLAEERLKKTTQEVLIEQNKPGSLNNSFAFSDIGLLFVKLYNKTTGDDAKVLKKYDNTGNVIGYSIIANDFQFSTGK